MSHSRSPRPPTIAQQLEALLGYHWPIGRPAKHDLSTWTVTDDWPDPVPVTEAEIAVFEQWFGDVIDELFGPKVWRQASSPLRNPRRSEICSHICLHAKDLLC